MLTHHIDALASHVATNIVPLAVYLVLDVVLAARLRCFRLPAWHLGVAVSAVVLGLSYDAKAEGMSAV